MALGRQRDRQSETLVAGACVNDIRVIWMDGRSEERRGQDTCRLVNVVFR